MAGDAPTPTPIPIPERERQALAEVGRTAISPRAAALLAGLVLATLAAVPLLDLVRDVARPQDDARAAGTVAAAGELARAVLASGRVLAAAGPVAANHELLAGMKRFEDELEAGSWLRQRALPPVQGFLTAALGVGNEQVYPGRHGWLFYRADVDAVAGPAFLDPRVLTRRARGGDAWTPPPRPDPLPALVDLRRQLAARGVALLVVPTPVKPSIHPEQLTPRLDRPPAVPLRNLSFDLFLERLAAAGIAVFDPAPLLAAAAAGGPQYLETDTHWRPEAVEAVAAALAERIEALVELSPRDGGRYFRRELRLEQLGDTATMLRLPPEQSLYARQAVSVRMVLEGDGSTWRPDPAAEVLLLGDSFTNIYSDPGLGWGAGAGLAEQLAFALARPLDRIALNAGGAYASRAALARRLAAGEALLAGKRLVVYQFAGRELAQGDWRLVDLGGGG